MDGDRMAAAGRRAQMVATLASAVADGVAVLAVATMFFDWTGLDGTVLLAVAVGVGLPHVARGVLV